MTTSANFHSHLTTAKQSSHGMMPPSTPLPSIDDAPLIDNMAAYPTPEGLMLTLMPAGLLPRLSAWLLDGLIKMVFYTVVTTVGVFFGEVGFGFMAIGYFLISWLYPVVFEVYRDGMTPGKKSQGIYVCHDDGTPITLQASLIRNLLRVADFLPLFYVSAAITMLFNRKSQRIGDIVAGTIVVYRDEAGVSKLFRKVYGATAGLANPDNYGNQYANNTITDATQASTNTALFFYPLTLTEQRALLSFAERAPFLSKARQLEIAANLLPLTNIEASAPAHEVKDSDSLASRQLLTTLYARIHAIRGYTPPASYQINNDYSTSNHFTDTQTTGTQTTDTQTTSYKVDSSKPDVGDNLR